MAAAQTSMAGVPLQVGDGNETQHKNVGNRSEVAKQFNSGSGSVVKSDLAARHRDRAKQGSCGKPGAQGSDTPKAGPTPSSRLYRASDIAARRMSLTDALERLEKVALSLQSTSRRLTKEDRTPLAEFEYILEQLDPAAGAGAEAFKRWLAWHPSPSLLHARIS